MADKKEHAPSDYLNCTEAAAYCRMGRTTFWKLTRTGRIPVARIGNRICRIARQDLDRMMQDATQPPQAAE